jgi:prepilin-type processing-associated H-X9-DG protein
MAAVALSAVLLAMLHLGIDTRENARRSACVNNLKQIGLAIMNHADYYGALPTGTVINPLLPPTKRLSWLTLNFSLFESNVQLLTDPAEPWDAGANLTPLIRHSPVEGPSTTAPAGNVPYFQCPSHRHPARPNGPGVSDYVGIAGLGTDAATLPLGHPRAGVFGYDRQVRFADIKDGANNTMMVVETSIAKGPFTAGGPATVRGLDPARKPYIGPGRQFGGIHPRGAAVLFADGSVRIVRETVDPKNFEAISTIAGGEKLDGAWTD